MDARCRALGPDDRVPCVLCWPGAARLAQSALANVRIEGVANAIASLIAQESAPNGCSRLNARPMSMCKCKCMCMCMPVAVAVPDPGEGEGDGDGDGDGRAYRVQC